MYHPEVFESEYAQRHIISERILFEDCCTMCGLGVLFIDFEYYKQPYFEGVSYYTPGVNSRQQWESDESSSPMADISYAPGPYQVYQKNIPVCQETSVTRRLSLEPSTCQYAFGRVFKYRRNTELGYPFTFNLEDSIGVTTVTAYGKLRTMYDDVHMKFCSAMCFAYGKRLTMNVPLAALFLNKRIGYDEKTKTPQCPKHPYFPKWIDLPKWSKKFHLRLYENLKEDFTMGCLGFQGTYIWTTYLAELDPMYDHFIRNEVQRHSYEEEEHKNTPAIRRLLTVPERVVYAFKKKNQRGG
jgi:hypothetical protein